MNAVFLDPTLLEQGSGAWLDARLGKCTASRVADAVARTKTGWSAKRATYMTELIEERLTGRAVEHFVSKDMLWGLDMQADAIAAYAWLSDVDVETIGFVPHPTIDMAGASPDGTIGLDGLIEVKCPKTATHIETLLGEPIDKDYLLQIQWQLACTGRAWCDFVSYDPRLPEPMRLFVQRVPRDDALIEALEGMVRDFLAEIDAKVKALNGMYSIDMEAAL